MMEFLTNYHIFGKVIGNIHGVEFQKRGLPHAHILHIISPDDGPRTADDYGKIVCAEPPDSITYPRLFEIVPSTMLHG